MNKLSKCCAAKVMPSGYFRDMHHRLGYGLTCSRCGYVCRPMRWWEMGLYYLGFGL